MNKKLRRWLILTGCDLLIALFAFWLARYFGDLPRWYWLVLSAILWVVFGVITHKLQFGSYKRVRYALMGILVAGLFSGVLIHFFFRYFIPGYEYDHSILLATILIVMLEWGLYYAFRRLVYRKIPFFYEELLLNDVIEKGMPDAEATEKYHLVPNSDVDTLLKVITESNSRKEVCEWIKENTSSFAESTVCIHSDNPEAILAHKTDPPALIIHSCSLNEIRHINTFLSYSNYCLANNGYIACHCTTARVRKERILRQSPMGLNYAIYFLDYCWHRIAPKLPITRNIYFGLTKGRQRTLTRVEVLGRLYRAGFEVVHEVMSQGEFYIIATCVKEPVRDDNPSSGLLIRLRRIGKDGEIIGVYKFRTMYAYSEYLQSYVYNHSELVKGDKIADDYRVNAMGRLARKFWIDELPQLINYLKGDIKLVGVRPLSQHKFSLYSKELQELRIKTKPGLIPPYYYDLPESMEEMEISEKKYLNAYLKNPMYTDWRYFWRIMWNIVVRGKRSK